MGGGSGPKSILSTASPDSQEIGELKCVDIAEFQGVLQDRNHSWVIVNCSQFMH